MPGPMPKPIELTDTEHSDLERLSKAHTAAQQIAVRSRIILEAGKGKNNAQVARILQVSTDMVRKWRERWLSLSPIPLDELSTEERLEDLPRPGAPPRITADQMCKLVALACEQPEKSGRPISHWTGREIADELMARGIVESISPRHAQRLLKMCRSQAASDSLLANS